MWPCFDSLFPFNLQNYRMRVSQCKWKALYTFFVSVPDILTGMSIICSWSHQTGTFPTQHYKCNDPILLQRLDRQAQASTGQWTDSGHVWTSVWDWGMESKFSCFGWSQWSIREIVLFGNACWYFRDWLKKVHFRGYQLCFLLWLEPFRINQTYVIETRRSCCTILLSGVLPQTGGRGRQSLSVKFFILVLHQRPYLFRFKSAVPSNAWPLL